MKSIHHCFAVVAFLILSKFSYANPACGEPPLLENSTLKGELSGKTQLLTRFVGDAQLTGKIETSRSEVLTKYPDAERTRGNAYFEYQVCMLVMNDKAMSTSQKIEELKKVRREFSRPISLDQKALSELSVAEAECMDAKFPSAQAIFRRLSNSYPDDKTIKAASINCDNLTKESKDIDINLEVAPAIYVHGEGDDAYLVRLALHVDDEYCGTLSNLNGRDSRSCTSRTGMRSFSMKSIALYEPDGSNVFRGGNCGGSFVVRPREDRYAVVMCLKKPYISCSIFPVDDEFYKFTHDKCKFKS